MRRSITRVHVGDAGLDSRDGWFLLVYVLTSFGARIGAVAEQVFARLLGESARSIDCMQRLAMNSLLQMHSFGQILLSFNFGARILRF